MESERYNFRYPALGRAYPLDARVLKRDAGRRLSGLVAWVTAQWVVGSSLLFFCLAGGMSSLDFDQKSPVFAEHWQTAPREETFLKIREKFEAGFEAWAGIVASRPLVVIALALSTVGVFATQLSELQLDTSTESYLLDGDPVRVAYNEMREQFGRDQVIVVALEPPEIFDREFLIYLQELHEALEDGVPYVERLTSLVNIRSVEGRGEELIVGDLLEELPQTTDDIEALRRRVMSTPSYLGGVISADGTITSIIVETNAYSSLGEFDALSEFEDEIGEEVDSAGREFITPAENSEVVEAVKAIVAAHHRA